MRWWDASSRPRAPVTSRGLIALLARDAVIYADGGGKAVALPNLIRGTNNVAHHCAGRAKFRPKEDVVSRLVLVNETPGIVSPCWGTASLKPD